MCRLYHLIHLFIHIFVRCICFGFAYIFFLSLSVVLFLLPVSVFLFALFLVITFPKTLQRVLSDCRPSRSFVNDTCVCPHLSPHSQRPCSTTTSSCVSSVHLFVRLVPPPSCWWLLIFPLPIYSCFVLFGYLSQPSCLFAHQSITCASERHHPILQSWFRYRSHSTERNDYRTGVSIL